MTNSMDITKFTEWKSTSTENLTISTASRPSGKTRELVARKEIMTIQFKLPPGLSSKDKINDWAKRYTSAQTGAEKLVEQYLIGLKDTVQGRKNPEAPRGYLLYNEFYDFFRWKLDRKPRSLKKNSEIDIEDITGKAFRLDNDLEKLDILAKEIHDVGRSVASAILHLYDQKKYPILDQHALRSLGVDEEHIYGPEYPFWQEYVDFCRAESEHYDVPMRTLDQALWKYSEVGILENEELRRRGYPRFGGKLAVTMPNGKQFRCRYGRDTYVKVIEEIGIEKVKNLNIIYGDNPLIRTYSYVNDGLQWVEYGHYEIRNPGAIYRQADLLLRVTKRLNIDLIIDYFW